MGQRTSVYLDDALHAAAKSPAFPSLSSSAAPWPPAPCPARKPRLK